MEITIIGTGNMARGIATRLLAAGHRVTLLGTSADKARELADELSGSRRRPSPPVTRATSSATPATTSS
jgi:3-hydroxyisobutyrate dehydrogenase-like beta-hydroxyacid dehydrogenase